MQHNLWWYDVSKYNLQRYFYGKADTLYKENAWY